MIKIGEKIRFLRKQKNISQEVLANSLGVSFQAVSKWENGAAIPDATLIPAIAYFFGVSTDELFDYNLYEIEKNVEAIVDEHSKYWSSDKEKCEQVLREGLKKYPGNDILLNCLIGVIPLPERSAEVIDICKALIESTRMDDVKYDAYHILAEAYKSVNEYSLAKDAIEHIPEIYFTKLGVAAELLNGEDMFKPAMLQKRISFIDLIFMYERLAQYYEEKGEIDKAVTELETACRLILATEDEVRSPFHRCSLFEEFSDDILKMKEKISALKKKI